MRIGKILGIPIFLHSTWVIIFAGITYSLAMQFAQQNPGWTPAQHWSVGVFTSVLFFASLLFHELAHSVVAQHYKIRVLSITLFIFGGVASIERDPSKAIQEFNIAIAGPLASGFLAGLFLGLFVLFPSNETVAALSDLALENESHARGLQSPAGLSARWRQNLPCHHLGRNQEFLKGHPRRGHQRPPDCLRYDPSWWLLARSSKAPCNCNSPGTVWTRLRRLLPFKRGSGKLLPKPPFAKLFPACAPPTS